MTPSQLHMLRTLQHGPRQTRYFTEGVTGSHPTRFTHDLAALEEYGYVERDRKETYSITLKGARALRNQPEPVPSRSIGNFSMPSGSYKSHAWPVRPGADDHKKFRSAGAPNMKFPTVILDRDSGQVCQPDADSDVGKNGLDSDELTFQGDWAEEVGVKFDVPAAAVRRRMGGAIG